MIIKNENFNEFLRYGIAMELIKKEMLIWEPNLELFYSQILRFFIYQWIHKTN
jgi:hypothetical protein